MASAVRKASSALRTISSAGSFGLLRCSMSASVRDSGGRSGRTMKSDRCRATATSGTMAMPRFDATALFNASTVPRAVGAGGDVSGRDLIRNVWRAGRKDGDQRLRAQRRDLELPVLDRQIHQPEIDPVLDDVFDVVARRSVGDDQVDAGMIETHLAQGRRQSIDHCRQCRADMHAADPALAKTTHRRVGVIALAKNAAGRLDELAARHGRMRPLAQALDQPHAETALEFANLQADRRLRQVEPSRCRGEAALLDHLEKGPQLVEVEAPQPKFSLSKGLKQQICLTFKDVSSS